MYLCGLDYTIQALADPYFIVSVLSLPVIALYNGERGLKIKYLFYAFYPGHILLLYIAAVFVGWTYLG
jgi:hypothetical protein